MPNPDASATERHLTVAHVRERDDGADVMFLESARIYHLPRTHPEYVALVAQLRRGLAAGARVAVRAGGDHGETIEAVRD